MKINYYLYIALIIFGCDSSIDNESLTVINLERSVGSYSKISLSSIAKTVEYIPLKTEGNTLIGQIREIFVSDDTIIVQGYDYCKTFDKKGRFLFNIGRVGKGPGEYLYINAFSVNQERHQIYITCNGKITIFTYKGEHVQTINIPFETWSKSEFIKDGIFCHKELIFKATELNKLYFFNTYGEILDSFGNRQPYERKLEFLFVPEQPQLYHGCDFMFFRDGFNDTIYKIDPDLKISPIYRINFGKYKLPLDAIKNIVDVRENPFQDYIFLNDILENRTFLFMNFDFGKHYPSENAKEEYVSVFGQDIKTRNSIVTAIYNKKKFVFTLLYGEKVFGFINDIDGGLSFWPAYIDHHNNAMYAWIDAFEFVHMLSEKQNRGYTYIDSAANVKLKQLTQSLKEFDNPIIIKVIGKE